MSNERIPLSPNADSRPDAPGAGVLAVGTRLAEFELTGVIGEGGFGIVYLARDRSLGRTVAIKEYMPSALASRAADSHVTIRSERHRETFAAGMRSFINEAQLLAQFDHPALVKVYRFWEGNGTAYMAMPYYQGMTLNQKLRKSDQVHDQRWLSALLAPLIEALEVLHQEQCFHRDIAPDNILILRNGNPLLLDFGAARRVIGDMTQALTVILKPGFAPIEQYAEIPGMKQGSWTDVYALAAVMYYVIKGSAPTPSVSRIVDDSMKPLAGTDIPGYDPAFLAAVDRALRVRPDQRTQTIRRFRDDLGITGDTRTHYHHIPATELAEPAAAANPWPAEAFADPAVTARAPDPDATVMYGPQTGGTPSVESRTGGAPPSADPLADWPAEPFGKAGAAAVAAEEPFAGLFAAPTADPGVTAPRGQRASKAPVKADASGRSPDPAPDAVQSGRKGGSAFLVTALLSLLAAAAVGGWYWYDPNAVRQLVGLAPVTPATSPTIASSSPAATPKPTPSFPPTGADSAVRTDGAGRPQSTPSSNAAGGSPGAQAPDAGAALPQRSPEAQTPPQGPSGASGQASARDNAGTATQGTSPAAAAPSVVPGPVAPATAPAVPAPSPSAGGQNAMTAPTAGDRGSPERPVLTNAGLLDYIVTGADSALEVELWGNPETLKINRDRFELHVRSGVAGYLYVFMLGSDNAAVTMLFPNTLDRDNRISANAEVILPRPSWGMMSGGPAGTDRVVAVVSRERRDFTRVPTVTEAPFSRFALDKFKSLPPAQLALLRGKVDCPPRGDECGRYGAARVEFTEVQ